MWRLLKALLAPATTESPTALPTLEADLADRAQRCTRWADADEPATIAQRLVRLRTPGGLPPDGEEILANAAAWLGEKARSTHDGRWVEHPFWGLVLEDLEGVQGLRLIPLAVIEKQMELGPRFDLAGFLAAIPRRIEAEKSVQISKGISLPRWTELVVTTDTAAIGLGMAESFRLEWKERLRAELPFTLVGVRELDGWLRSHYLINRLEEPTLIRAGFFVGEVARGLFGGSWAFAEGGDFHDAALRFPELDYFPIGRLYKQLLERPEGEKLDEYIRLVPSARQELRKTTSVDKDTP